MLGLNGVDDYQINVYDDSGEKIKFLQKRSKF